MYGIVLEGGGGRGAYQLGAWKALRELGITYQGVAGTSVGALNGAMMVQGDFEPAMDIWSNITPAKIVKIDERLYEKIKNFKITSDDTTSLLHSLKSIFRNRGMDTTPLRSLLQEHIDEQRIRKAKLQFGLITISLTDLTPLKLFLEDIPQGKLIDYLLASASIPGFRRQRIDNKAFIDGGVYDNLPVSLLVQKGFKNIIIVRLIRKGIKKWEKDDELKITLIKPSESLGSIFDFTRERALKNIELGYFDTLKVFRGYRGKSYCIDPKQDEEYFLKLIFQMDQASLDDLLDSWGTSEGMPQKRIIMEKIVPLLVELLPVPSQASYQDIIIALLERAASKTGMERFKIYSYNEFETEVIKRYRPTTQPQLKLPKILLGNELLLRTKSEQILDKITTAVLYGMKHNYV